MIVKFVTKEGQMGLKLGNYLGELTDESDGAIQEFVVAGPKNYMYQT